MSWRINPLWWPLLALASPVLVPMLAVKNKRFGANMARAEEANRRRIREAGPLDLPILELLELTVLVEEKTLEGFSGDAGVSYFFQTEKGSLLFDVGFGPERPALAKNAQKLGIGLDRVDALAISHLHPDHMGGLKASSAKKVLVPEELGQPRGAPCYLPDQAEAEGFAAEVVPGPALWPCGMATTGPLARSLFLMGYTEEQALVARVKGKGLAVFTGCGHPTAEVILQMARCLSDEPVYSLAGGLHFPVTKGRGSRLGIEFQRIIGTGKPIWKPIDDDDLTRTIKAINASGLQEVYLSAHDTCDHALTRFESELNCRTIILRAGETYRF